MSLLLRQLLRRIVRSGRLGVAIGANPPEWFGTGETADAIVVRLRDPATARAIALDPNLKLGEAYMDGRLVIERGSVYDLVALLMRDIGIAETPGVIGWADRVRRRLAGLGPINSPRRSRRNVEHHYDLNSSLYDLFLDARRQYSCAYFGPGDDLEAAQERKLAHIAAKLALEPGQSVLDIGCGWGGLAEFLADRCGADVTGITLSTAQLAYARKRQAAGRRRGATTFRLADYREVAGRFDRIVSVGMLEHVGTASLPTYFRRIRDLLADDGVALVHTIGRSDGPGFTNPFIRRYIFPGGYFPALSELLPAVERSGLLVTDIEVLRLHYAETLKAWRERFLAKRDEAVERFGDRFCRMWEIYLAGSEAAFRYQGLVVFQLQLARRVDTLPIMRDYMLAAEQRLLAVEGRGPRLWPLAGE